MIHMPIVSSRRQENLRSGTTKCPDRFIRVQHDKSHMILKKKYETFKILGKLQLVRYTHVPYAHKNKPLPNTSLS